MALGLPVVSTRVGGIPYLLKHEDNSLLVEDNDLAGMTQKVDSLFKDKALAEKISKNIFSNFDRLALITKRLFV